jgi:hypothetical protein
MHASFAHADHFDQYRRSRECKQNLATPAMRAGVVAICDGIVGAPTVSAPP